MAQQQEQRPQQYRLSTAAGSYVAGSAPTRAAMWREAIRWSREWGARVWVWLDEELIGSVLASDFAGFISLR